jgi:hypothetical protein
MKFIVLFLFASLPYLFADNLVLRSCDRDFSESAGHDDIAVLTPIDYSTSVFQYEFCRDNASTSRGRGRELQYVTGARLVLNNEHSYSINLCSPGADFSQCARQLQNTRCLSGKLRQQFAIPFEKEHITSAYLHLLDIDRHAIVQLCLHEGDNHNVKM